MKSPPFKFDSSLNLRKPIKENLRKPIKENLRKPIKENLGKPIKEKTSIIMSLEFERFISTQPKY